MARAPRITDDDLHRILWEHTNSRGKLLKRLYDLAPEIRYSQPGMTGRVQKLIFQGRVKKIKWDYWVVDPADWASKHS